MPVQSGNRPPMSTSVNGFVVKPKTIADNIEVPGSLLANESTDIHPEVSGRVVQLNISEGKYVSRGTLLAKLYDGDLVAQLRKLEVQLEIAAKTEERQAQLLKIQGISQQDYDLSLLQVNNLKADIDIIKTSIAKTEIRAPFDGRLGLKNVSPGAFVTNQTILCSIRQVDLLKLDFSVPEKYSDEIKTGQEVDFSVEGGGTKLFKARILATEAKVSENTRTLNIRALVVGRDPALIPGSFAKVTLHFEPNRNALMVPTEAVIPQARGKKLIVYRGGNAEFRDVNTGVRDSAFVQITAGIEAGDTVIITGLLSIRPGGKLSLEKVVN